MAAVMPRPRAATQCPAMARDTDTDTAATGRRKRAGGKERRSASSREKTKEEGKGKGEEKMAADIQEELTQKLENLLERDRLGVSMRLLAIHILYKQTDTNVWSRYLFLVEVFCKK